MKKYLSLSLCAIFMFGVLFPVSRTSEGSSYFVQDIKKLFHCPSNPPAKGEPNKGPYVVAEGGSALFQKIRDIFHYYPEDAERPKPKEYPKKFEGTVQRELRYPPQEETK